MSFGCLDEYRCMHKNRNNILLLIPTFTEGGAQKMVCEIGKILSERYNVFECSYNAFGEPHVFKNNNTVLSLESPHNGSFLKKVLAYPKKVIKLRKLKKEYSIDVTISNLWSADLINILSGTADKKISIGHISIKGNYQNRLLLKYRKLAKAIYSRFNKIIAVNEALMHELSDLFEIPGERIHFINNFIAYPDKLQVNFSRDIKKKRIVNVGRLNPIKNQEPLLYIFKSLKKQYPNLQLLFVGSGPLESELKDKANELGLRVATNVDEKDADVVFTGFADPYVYTVASDIFVFPSKSEGLPLVMLEAMYTGLPVVSSDCPTGGPHVVLEAKSKHQPDREEVEETEYGYLMPIPKKEDKNTLHVWEFVISGLLSDDNTRIRMGKKAKQRSLDFSVDKIKQQWYKSVEEVLQ